MIHISFYVSILASIVLFIRVLTARERGRDLQLFLLSIVSLSIMYAHGVSFMLEEHAVIPSIGLMFAVLLPLVKGPARLKAVALYACCFTLIFSCAVSKVRVALRVVGVARTKHPPRDAKIDDRRPEGLSRLSPDERGHYWGNGPHKEILRCRLHHLHLPPHTDFLRRLYVRTPVPLRAYTISTSVRTHTL